MTRFRMVVFLNALAAPAFAGAATPTLYSNPLHEAPVQGSAGDLLLLGGAGLASDARVQLRRRDGREELLRVVPGTTAPDVLVVRLPQDLGRDEVVVLSLGRSSTNPAGAVTINDRRPAWLAPALTYSTQTLGNLPRELRIIGRNLRPSQEGSDRLRLAGPAVFELGLQPPASDDRAFSAHVAVATLPPALPTGRYEVSLVRAGAEAVIVPGGFEVVADPPAPRTVPLRSEGCRPDDGQDDTACLARAIERLTTSGGGVVEIDDGTWDLAASPGKGGGLSLPLGVSLRGAGAARTRVQRHPGWRGGTTEPAFTLIGHNRIEGISFADLRPHRVGDPKSAILRIGAYDDGSRDVPATSDIVVTRSVFEQAHPAIADGGAALSRIVITYNLFGAWSTGIELSGNRFNMRRAFRLDAAIIRHNLFLPGSYLDREARQGAMAAEIGASDRLDFSDNVADGTQTAYLRAPEDAAGWRAGFFWHMNNSHERLLVARNRISCPGDKIGDGEAIAFDNNANTFALREPAVVRAAGAAWIEIDGPLAAEQNSRAVDVASYYRGHWIQVVSGTGLGQSRRIREYQVGGRGRVRFQVEPAWDVVPAPGGASVLINRVFWQAMVLDNLVDQRQPSCRKSNLSAAKGGQIALWAPTSASTVQGNLQFDTDGIVYQQSYTAADPACATCTAQAFTQYFLDIRGNRVEGEYAWDSDCSASGIQGSYSAAPTGTPPTVSFGVNIARNLIRQADGLRGGAISLPLTWHAGPAPYEWPLVRGTTIHHNQFDDVDGPGARRDCGTGDGAHRAGVVLSPSRLLHAIVVDANRCVRTPVALRDPGMRAASSCETAPGACACDALTSEP